MSFRMQNAEPKPRWAWWVPEKRKKKDGKKRQEKKKMTNEREGGVRRHCKEQGAQDLENEIAEAVKRLSNSPESSFATKARFKP